MPRLRGNEESTLNKKRLILILDNFCSYLEFNSYLLIYNKFDLINLLKYTKNQSHYMSE